MASPRLLVASLLALLALAVGLRGGVTPASAALVHAVAGGIGLAWATRRNLRPAPRSALLLAGGWVGLALASTLWSRSPDASLDASAALAAAALVFVLATLLPDRRARQHFSSGFALLGSLVAGVAIAAAAAGTRAHFPFGNPNHLAAFLLLPAGLGFVATASRESIRRGRREEALLWFGSAAIAGAAVAATGSAGAGLGVLAGVGAYALLSTLGARRGAVLAAVVFAGVAVGLALLPALWPSLLPTAAGGSESSPGLRWAVWAAAGRAAWEAGPLGVGVGAFPAAFLGERPDGVPYAARHAHSEPLHGVVELGIPFLCLLAVTLVVTTREIGGRLSRGASRTAWGAATGLLALVAHALVDFPLHVPAIALAAAALAGRLWSRGPVSPATLAPLRATRAALVALSLASVGLAGSQGGALLCSQRAEAQLAAGRFADALRSAEIGLRLRPGRAELHAVTARAAEHAWRFAGRGAAMRERALAAFDRAVAVDPADPSLRVERAALRARVGDPTGALTELEIAARLDPRSPVPHLATARLHLDAGRRGPAARSLRAALERHPRATAPAIQTLLRATGEPDLLRATLPDGPRSHRIAATVLSGHGFVRAAAEEYARAYAAAPADVDAALRAAAHFTRARDVAAAEAVLEHALEASPADPALRARLAALRAARAPRPDDSERAG